jgi:hypothetical protein
MKRHAAAALVLISLAGASARAQTRPLLTEEATTAVARTLVVEVGQDFMHDELNYQTDHRRDRLDGPTLRFVYSPADNVEMDLEWVSRVSAFGDPDRGQVSDWGDVSLRAKLRLVEGRAGAPTIAARFGMTLPQTTYLSSLGPNTIRMSAQMLLSQPLGGGLTLHVNAGLALQDEVLRPHEQRDFLAYGLALEWPVGRGVALLGELAGLRGKGMSGVDAHTEMRLGARLGTGRVRWDAALRRGFAHADGTWGATAGLTWTRRR